MTDHSLYFLQQFSLYSNYEDLLSVIDTLNMNMSVNLLESIIETSEQTVLCNVFQFPFLNHKRCVELTEVLNERNAYNLGSETNTLQKFTVDAMPIIGEVIEGFVTELKHKINQLYDFGDETIDYAIFSSHAIFYNANGIGETKLERHVDDSDITVNITLLAQNLTGCSLRFIGSPEYRNSFCLNHFDKVRGKIDSAMVATSVTLGVGNCVLHRGDHAHEVDAIQTGNRVALIIWLKRTNT